MNAIIATANRNYRDKMKPHSRFNALSPLNSKHKVPVHMEIADDEQKMQTAEGEPETENEAPEGNNIRGVKTQQFLQTFRQLVFKHFKCPICQSILKDPLILECNHLFCQECLNEWIQVLQMKSEIKSCPVCRKLIRNSVDATDIPNCTMGSFLTKFAAVEQALRCDSNLACEREQLMKVLKALDIPYNFNNTETIYNLTYSRYLSKLSRMNSCLDLMHQIKISQNEKWEKRVKAPKNLWQTFQANTLNTCRMICPNCLTSLLVFIYEWRRVRNTQGQWTWTRPKPIFYSVTLLTILYFYFVYLFGSTILNHTGIKQSVKRLLQHTVFICLDIPTFELVNIIREAFLIPM